MHALFARAVAIATGAALLWLINLGLDPVPVAAGPAFALGAICFLVPALDGWRSVPNLAAGAGAIIGAWVHRGWHLSGQSPPPAGGLLQHVFFEGLLGFLAALLCLAVAYLVLNRLMVKSKR